MKCAILFPVHSALVAVAHSHRSADKSGPVGDGGVFLLQEKSRSVLAALLGAAAGLSQPRGRYAPPPAAITEEDPPLPAPPLPPVSPLLALLLSAQAGPGHVTPAGPAACSPALLQQLLLAQCGRYLPYGLGSYGFYGGGAAGLPSRVLGGVLRSLLAADTGGVSVAEAE
ncbi:uncharacterized protein LOC134542951 [Bacillus rossius redtenbacheri]|uniref:uncharacterized protein LOC134542951 n=1 Tax=Bacillus rossius redtenbacheri TaxID=93214 RepID=UPI002FDEDD69